jgi:hypothetical protein
MSNNNPKAAGKNARSTRATVGLGRRDPVR